MIHIVGRIIYQNRPYLFQAPTIVQDFPCNRSPGNYSNNRRFARSAWLCHCKESQEEESHLLSGHCTVYGDFTLKYSDLTDDKSLDQSFNEVLARRDASDKKRTTPVGVGDTFVGANPIS